MRVRLRQGVYSTTKEGEALLIDAASGVFFALNATGTEILAAFERGDIDALVCDWATRFGLPEHRIREDIDEFFKQLAEQALVEVDEARASGSTG